MALCPSRLLPSMKRRFFIKDKNVDVMDSLPSMALNKNKINKKRLKRNTHSGQKWYIGAEDIQI